MPKKNNIWICSESFFKKKYRLRFYEDWGSITLKNRIILFKGDYIGIKKVRINNIELSKSNESLFSIFRLCYMLSILEIIFMTFSVIKGNIELNFYLPIMFSVILCFIAIPRLFQKKNNEPWVIVTGITKEGTEEKMYLFDGRGSGWQGVFGGTKKLYEQLKKYHEHVKSAEHD